MMLEVHFDPGRVRPLPSLQGRRAVQGPDASEQIAEDARRRGRLWVDVESE